MIVGPDAAVAIMVGAAVGPLADSDPGKAVAISAWLALLVAIILFLAAWLRLGAAADFLSNPVMHGFMNGAAVVIIGSQLGKLCNLRLEQDNTLLRLYEWLTRLPQSHTPTVAIGLAVIGLLAALRIWVPRLPGTIVVFASALMAGRCFDFAAAGMQTIGAIDTSIPAPVPPELSISEVPRLFTAALGMAQRLLAEGRPAMSIATSCAADRRIEAFLRAHFADLSEAKPLRLPDAIALPSYGLARYGKVPGMAKLLRPEPRCARVPVKRTPLSRRRWRGVFGSVRGRRSDPGSPGEPERFRRSSPDGEEPLYIAGWYRART